MLDAGMLGHIFFQLGFEFANVPVDQLVVLFGVTLLLQRQVPVQLELVDLFLVELFAVFWVLSVHFKGALFHHEDVFFAS